MIVKGIIKSIDFGSNTCMVRIPTWEPVGNPETVIPAVFSVTPGTFNSYKENDVVWVAFENNIASHPVVIGKLYTGTNADKTEPRGVVNCQSLTVSDSATLPASTRITQATSDILDERNGLQVQSLDELIAAVAENAATISNLVILEENPNLGEVTYSYAFSASEVRVEGHQPTATDWNELKTIAGDADKLTKDDFTPEEFEGLNISKAAKLWLTAGGEWLKGSEKADDPNNWKPQTGYMSEETWLTQYAITDAYPLLNVFKRTKTVYYQQGLDRVVTTDELVRSPRLSYPTEYRLKMTADTHAGAAQTETIYITAVKRFAGTLEEADTDAHLWYWNPNPGTDGKKKWIEVGAADNNRFSFPAETFTDIIKDRDLVVIATHIRNEVFDPNTAVGEIPDPLAQNTTWEKLVADERVYEIETIPYSPLNTPVINLDNDTAALPYDQDGVNVLYGTEVSTTASVYLNGEDISGDFTFTWSNEGGDLTDTNPDGELINTNPNIAEISNDGRTILVKVAGTYDVVATKNQDASPSYSVPDGKLTKTFTVVKQPQGEAMMSSVITSSAGTSFNTKDTGDLTTILTAYLYRGTEEYLPGGLYYEWHTISKDGTDATLTIEAGTDYEPTSLGDEKYKSIKVNNIAATLKDKSVYFIAYKNKQHADDDSVLNVARLGITLLGKN